jgi:hypothetical protein
MSRINDPLEEGGGPGEGGGGFVDPSEGNRVGGSGEENREDDKRGEGGKGGGKEGGKEGGGREGGGDAPKTASKGINPVQHSE